MVSPPLHLSDHAHQRQDADQQTNKERENSQMPFALLLIRHHRGYARHICQRLLIDLSWNSSRLEGNTYSLLETEQLLQAGRSGDAQLSKECKRFRHIGGVGVLVL